MTDAVVDRPGRARVRTRPLAAQSHRQVESKQGDFSTELLLFEGEVRAIGHEHELCFHLCNSARRVIPYQQCFYGSVSKAGKFVLKTSSSVSIVDRNVPFNRWIEKLADKVIGEQDSDRQIPFSLPEFCDSADEERDTYPFPEFLWTPQFTNGRLVGGTLMTREHRWIESDMALVNRASELYLHAQAAIRGQKSMSRTRPSVRPVLASICVLGIALGFLPVSITALAPVEVVPRQPYVLAAPFDGVVKEISASQGQALESGDTVVVFDDVHLLNEKKLVDQRAEIAAARYQRASQGAIADHRVKREIEVAKAEYELAKAESLYANELLEQARMVSPVPGIAIFSDKSDWEGKPVSAGEAIVSVADPSKIQLDIDLPAKESIVLSEGARIKIFLDSDPMNPLEASLIEASYRAQPDKRDIMSYSLSAELSDGDVELPRIGVQGTAQVFSDKASLAYVIFRRPITAFRQYTGW